MNTLTLRGVEARAAYAMAVVLDNIDVVAALDQLQEAFDLAFLDGMNDHRSGQSIPLTLERVPELAMYWRMGARCANDTDLLLFGLYTPAWWTPNMENGLVRPDLRIDGLAA